MRLAWIGLGFATAVLLARVLGPEGFGAYSYVLAWLLFGAALVQAGFPQLLVREVATCRAQSEAPLAAGVIRAATGLVLAASLVFTAGLLALHDIGLLAPLEPVLLYVGLPVLLLRAAAMTLQAASRGYGHVLRGQAAELVVRPVLHVLLLLVLLAGLLPVPLDPVSAMGAYALAAFAGLLYAIWALRPLARTLATRSPRYEVRGWLASSGKLGVYTWMTAVNLHTAPIALGMLAVATEVAEFRVAWHVAALVPIGHGVMNAIHAPALASAHARADRAALQSLASRHCMIGIAAAAPLCLLVLFWGEGLVALAFGEAYRAAAAPLVILALAQLANAAVGPVGLLMISARQERALLLAQAAVVGAHVLLLLALTPVWGAIGAAAASGAAIVALNLVLLLLVRSRLGIWSLPLGRVGGVRPAATGGVARQRPQT